MDGDAIEKGFNDSVIGMIDGKVWHQTGLRYGQGWNPPDDNHVYASNISRRPDARRGWPVERDLGCCGFARQLQVTLGELSRNILTMETLY